MLRAAVIVLLLSTAVNAADLDVPRFLYAIRAVEGWQGRDGRHGERGPWQLTAKVWAMHMPGRSFVEARLEGPSRTCAIKHVTWLAAGLQRHGYQPTPARVATAWNIGLTATIRRRARPTDYGQRAANLYSVLP